MVEGPEGKIHYTLRIKHRQALVNPAYTDVPNALSLHLRMASISMVLRHPVY